MHRHWIDRSAGEGFPDHVCLAELKQEMEIRKAHHSDLPRLTGLWLEFMEYHRRLDPDYELEEGAIDRWVEYVTSKFDDESAQLFVADCDGKLVAYAGAVIRDYPPVFTLKNFGCIEEIAVSLGHRRKGIAGQLFTAAEEWLLSRNVDRIGCANDGSLGFFRDHGFQDHVVRLIRKY